MASGATRRHRTAPLAVVLATLLTTTAAHGEPAPVANGPVAAATADGSVNNAAQLNAPAGLLANDLGRNLLRYIVQCALPADATLTSIVDGKPMTFSGALGLAPAWHDRPLTPEDQRWVSACVLARVNYFGEKVPINLQGDHPLPALRTMDDESRAYDIDEGAFYGNLFLPQPVAYSCSGRGPFPAQSPWVAKRLCTRPQPGRGNVTWCSFISTGPCSKVCASQDAETGAYKNCKAPDGGVYSQVLTTHLRQD